MRIAIFIGVLMMDAVRGNPGDGPAFEGERAAHCQEVLNKFRCHVSAMGQQAVISHADAEAPSDPPQHDRNDESLPSEEEERRDGAYVECSHKSSGQIDPLGKRFVSSADAHL